LCSLKVEANVPDDTKLEKDILKVTSNPAHDSGDGCPCIDASSLLASIPSRSCGLPDGEMGVRLSVEQECAPLSYGSSECLSHDLYYDSFCTLDHVNKKQISGYCVRPWCYVNAELCMKSSERIYRSSYFPSDTGIDLFYSYTKCNSTADDWLATFQGYNEEPLKKITLRANIPDYVAPMIYKKDPLNGNILTATGDEYYNNSIPFQGVYIDYVKKLMKVSIFM